MIDPELEIQELLHLPVNIFKACDALYYDWSVGNISAYSACEKLEKILYTLDREPTLNEKNFIIQYIGPMYNEYKTQQVEK